MPHKDKTTYKTYRHALRALLTATRRRGTPLRIYPCSECKGWHLTSRPR